MTSAFLKKLTIVLLALSALGFLVQTPEERRENERQLRKWQSSIKKNYNLRALHSFLANQLSASRVVDGIDLGKSRTAQKWEFTGGNLSCGDWSFHAASSDAAEFTLVWVYERQPREGGAILQKRIVLTCERVSKSQFELVRADRREEEVVQLML